MTGIVQDVRYALRGLGKNPSYTAVAVLTLALGIGANTAMFTVLNAALLRPLPYPSPDELVMLWTDVPGQGTREGRSTYLDVEAWRTRSKSLADVAVYDPVSVRLTAPGELDRISVVRTSANFFTILSVRPFRGRVFTASEAMERRRVAVISYRFAQARFGGADNALGATIALDDMPSEVIGVTPPGFQFGDPDVWEPHTLFPDWDVRRGAQTASSWFAIGRLRPQATVAQAQAELSAIAQRLDETRAAPEDARGVVVMPLSRHLVGTRARLALWMLTGAVFCVLLIGVTNITSLSLARSAGRDREFALRTALGASRGRVFRQLFTESLTLGVFAGAAGVLVARAGLPLVLALAPAGAGAGTEARLDGAMLASTLGLSLITGMLVGLAPVITAGRLNPGAALHGGSKGSSSGAARRLTRHALVVAEFALAIVLLVGAGLLTRSLLRVQGVDPGFNPDRVMSMQFALPESHTSAQRATYFQQVLERVESVPGVERAGVIGDLFIGATQEQIVTVEGSASGSRRLPLRRDEVSGGVFETLGVALIRGRMFSAEDGADAPPVAIVNEAMAGRLWPEGDPVGKRFKFGPFSAGTPWFTVVGVVGDMRRQGLEHDPIPQMFEPLAQNPSRLATLLVRTSNEPLSLAAALRAEVRPIDARVPLYGASTVAARLAAFEAPRRFQTSLVIAFSLVALVLAAVGIYGVVQYSTATRTREIGVRMAVGAQRTDIFRMVVGEGLKLSVAGVALGLVSAIWLGRIGSSLLFGVGATDPVTYAGVSLLLIAVALAGCYLPARRAARLDPLKALRYE